ncbi:phenylacetate--CoA ligase family protein [Candidatus Woesearchaeota archaeon]|nr:MAG: phenylacetate--CoA ligase family protein [Candidatus Woesearchaeota archaeon]
MVLHACHNRGSRNSRSPEKAQFESWAQEEMKMGVRTTAIRLLMPKKRMLMEEALREERIPVEELKKKQWELTQKIIRHAYENVPMYREKFKQAGITPEDIKKPEDMKKIPITTKDDIRNGFPDKILAEGTPPEAIEQKKSSGSTGRPTPYYADTRSYDEERKAIFRIQNAMGISADDSVVLIRNTNPESKRPVRRMMKALFSNTHFISTKEMDLDNMNRYVNFIKKHKPKMIESFPHQILQVAKHMKEKGIRIPVEYVHLIGGNLNDKDREILKEVFDCKIYNHYGAGECMHVAYQCEKLGPYHLEIGRYFVEVIRDGRDAKEGELGEIILTHLYNYAMPLIRYRIGDVALAGGKCNCGRTYPVIKEIKGRTRQMITLPTGVILDPNRVGRTVGRFCMFFDDYQLAYRKDKTLILRIIPKREYSDETEEKILNAVRELTKNSVPIIIKRVKKIDKYGGEDKRMETLAEIPPDLTQANSRA